MPKKKILIVEDNRMVAADMKIMLENMGYHVSGSAAGGREALSLLDENAPDLILMDSSLKGELDGIETGDRIQVKKDVPIVYTTAYADDDTLRRAKETEPYGYIVKPIKREELKSTIEMALYKHKMERKLKAGEQWLRTTLRSIGEGVIATDMEGCVTFMNPVAEALTGWTEKEASGRPLAEVFHIIHGITRELCEHPADKVVETGQVIGLANHTLLISRDGREIQIKDSGAPIRLESGENLGAVLVFQDDSEARESEKKIRENEVTLRKAQEVAKIGSWWYDPVTQMPTWTEEMFHIFGLPPGPTALPYDEHRKIIHPEDWERFDAAVTKAVTEGIAYNLELRVIRPNHEIAHINARCMARKNEEGVVVELMGTTQDITELKSVENALRLEKEVLRAIIDHIPVLITLYDPKINMLLVNRAFEKTLGWSNEEIKQVDVMEACYPDPEYRGQVQAYMEKASSEWREFTVATKTGGSVNSIWSNVRMESGVRIGIGIDVTEKKKLEDQLRQAQKMEAIGTLAGGIAHDFNNILSAVIGYTELTLDDLEPGSKLADNMQAVYTAGKRARDLVKQILMFARQADEVMRPVQVALIAKEVLKLIRSSTPATIEIRSAITSDSLIMGNPTQVHQLFVNLCTNAAQAMEEDGGKLNVSMVDLVIEDGAEISNPDLKPGEYLKIHVSDTGKGIAPDIIESIFEPYFTTKEPEEGTGLGLATVHGIVETYGGKIFVDSAPGEGTDFCIYLPVVKKRGTKRKHDSTALRRGDERILFVDDEKAITEMVGQILEKLGYSVTKCTNSLDALEFFRAGPNNFDLVITDMTMPDMTGDKLTENLMAIRPDIPIILCTGYSKKISEEDAMKIGIKAFVYKPIVRKDLTETVRRVLDARELESSMQ